MYQLYLSVVMHLVGVVYEGGFNAGEFAQMGVLYFPSGARIEGFWFAGKLIWSKYYFNDNLYYHHNWRYCKMPDRRYVFLINTIVVYCNTVTGTRMTELC